MIGEGGPEAFEYELRATRIVFGAGKIQSIGDEVARLHANKPFLLISRDRLRALPHLLERLRIQGQLVYSAAAQHVPDNAVEAAISALRDAASDLLIALGGGSSIGLGKALAVRSGLPLLAVPTTYSGSEMTAVWGITGPNGKQVMRDERAASRTVLYDPELTLTLSPQASGASGMNALAHTVEAMYSPGASPTALAIAEEAARLIVEHIVQVTTEPNNLHARSSLLSGSHLAGRALDMTSMGLHHRICHVLGGTFNLPHAETHAVLLPHVVEFNASAAPSAMMRLGRALGGEPVAKLKSLRMALPIPQNLRQLGFDTGDIDRAAAEIAAKPYPNPRTASAEDIRAILVAATNE